MKNFKSLLLLSAALLTFSCDNKEENKPAPVEPEAPVIASASLKGADNASEVPCEAPAVVFNAEVSVEGSTLNDWTLQIKNGSEVIGSAQGSLEGTTATISKEIELLLNPAAISEDFIPTVTLKVTNTDELFTEYTLKEAESVKVLAPKVYEKLYLIDNNSKVYEMGKTAVQGKFRTTAENLAEIGTSFTITTAVEGTAPAAGAKKWENIQTPDTGEYGLIWLSFDMNTEEVTKMIDCVKVIDLSAMAVYSEGINVFWSLDFVQDCKVEFLNAPEGLKLQGDRFADVEGTVCRYTGPTRGNYEGVYIPACKWFIIKYQWNALDAYWLTGEGGSVPMEPYAQEHPLEWFSDTPSGASSYTTVSLLREDDSHFRGLVYLKENFAIKIYSAFGWAFEVTPCSSITPETLAISPIEANPETGAVDGNYGNAGTNFTEGLYMLRINTATSEVALEKYTGELPVINPAE